MIYLRPRSFIFLLLAALVFLLILAAMIFVIISRHNNKSAVVIYDRSLNIPINEITENARIYPITANDVNMEILAVRDSNDTIRIVFNTCERCFTTGNGFFEQDKNELVCQSCQMRISIDSIGITSGGCQPILIPDEEISVTEKKINISYNALLENSQWFFRDELNAEEEPDLEETQDQEN